MSDPHNLAELLEKRSKQALTHYSYKYPSPTPREVQKLCKATLLSLEMLRKKAVAGDDEVRKLYLEIIDLLAIRS